MSVCVCTWMDACDCDNVSDLRMCVIEFVCVGVFV